MTAHTPPVLEARNLTKYFGRVIAVHDVSLAVRAGEVLCLLGDNGAGKSTMIKMLSGVVRPDAGEVRVDGRAVTFQSPRDALDWGVATVYQDLAMVPLLSVARNFFFGSEPTVGRGPWRRLDMRRARDEAQTALAEVGIDLRDPDQHVATLSGGERQSLAIARAIHFGARAVILDEPTSALGVKEAGIVLRYVLQAKARGVAIVLITHNINHAHPVGDRFVILDRGRQVGSYSAEELSPEELVTLMGGGAELADLRHELAEYRSELTT